MPDTIATAVQGRAHARPSSAAPSRPPGTGRTTANQALAPAAHGHRPLPSNRAIYLLWYGPVGAINLFLLERVSAHSLLCAEAALLNLLLTVVLRNDQLVMALNRAAVRLPLRGRRAKYVANRMAHQLGGAHTAAALCTTAWMAAACAASFTARGPALGQALSAAILALLAAMALTALPAVRHARHDLFERVHRYGGWTALGLATAQAAVASPQGATGREALSALAASRSFVLVAAAAGLVALPWLTLQTSRRVGAELLAGKAVKLTFPARGACGLGSFVRVSFDLLEWHSFAVASWHGPPARGGDGRIGVLIAAAGDWTRALAERVAAGRPPRRIWVRRVRPPGFMHTLGAYRRTVVLATGAGIAPVLPYVAARQASMFVVWIAKDPEATLGEAASMLRGHPYALVHDTERLGRPDPTRLALAAAAAFGAEAVFCVSNPASTKQVLEACLARGVPAYGATWDS